MVGRPAIAGIISVSCVAFLVFNWSLSTQKAITLESSDECMPCSTGAEDLCHAGCLTRRGIRMRLLSVKSLQSQLALLKKSKKVSSTKRASPLAPTSVRKGTELSVESAKRDILRENAQLLRLNKSKQGGLGEILDSAEKNLLRAEAAEVRMRRQAKLQGGDQKTIKDVFRHLRFHALKLHLL
jgi:hypothetical protein